MADYERSREADEKKDESGKERLKKNGSFSGEGKSGLNLQALIGDLENNPGILKYLSGGQLLEIAEKIGNQRLQAMLGGGGPLLRGKKDFFTDGNKETKINDISTGTPELIRLR